MRLEQDTCQSVSSVRRLPGRWFEQVDVRNLAFIDEAGHPSRNGALRAYCSALGNVVVDVPRNRGNKRFHYWH